MFYAKKKLGAKDFATKEDLEDYIKDSDPKKRISNYTRQEILNTSRAERLLEAGLGKEDKPVKDTITAKAIKAELARQANARASDEKKTAKRVTPITNATFKAWKKNPAKFDLRGIDTATHTFIKDEINKRLAKARAAGYTVGTKGVDAYRQERGNLGRSLITGRFLKIR